MTGMWRFNGANKNNYRAALAIRVEVGTSQATTRLNIYNATFRNCPIGISNGEYNVDYQCSEINVFGANFFKTPIPIYNGGSNSGMQLIGCNITSEFNGNFVGLIETAIWQEGGFLKVTGGSVVTNPTASYAITANPCHSELYKVKSYGTLDVVGAHFESNSPLLNINNPRGFATTESGYSKFNFVANTGYVGGDIARDFIYVSDPSYAGLIEIKNCNWYSDKVRQGYNMSGLSPVVRFSVDKTSLGKNFKNWLGGIGYGRVVHEMAPITSVSGLGETYVSGTTNILKFKNKDCNKELGKYCNLYNISTGNFEVPIGGFSTLQIQCGIAGTGTTAGDLYLTRGGTIVAFGNFNGVGNLNVAMYDLLAGELIAIVFKPYVSNFVADENIYNFIKIIGDTR